MVSDEREIVTNLMSFMNEQVEEYQALTMTSRRKPAPKPKAKVVQKQRVKPEVSVKRPPKQETEEEEDGSDDNPFKGPSLVRGRDDVDYFIRQAHESPCAEILGLGLGKATTTGPLLWDKIR